MNKIFRKFFLLALGVLSVIVVNAQTIEEQAQKKIQELEKLVKKAKKKKINVLKENTTLRTAEVFLKFANWDEKNIDANERYFKEVKIYRKEANTYAKELPDFERKDVVKMLDEAILKINKVLSGKYKRQESPKVDWKKITHKNDQLTFNNRPVFLADYTWKPHTKKLTEYHGDLDGFYITTGYVNYDGTVNQKVFSNLQEKTNHKAGFIFLNHKKVPNWTTRAYGANFKMRENTYTAYDIDNPGARTLLSNLLKGFVPEMAGKKYTELGYMLVNEPHFFVYKDKTKKKEPWATGPISNYTVEKYKNWLQEKHKNINTLNKVWKTNFTNFKTIDPNIPLDVSLQGSPVWYDWTAFNMDRVTDWYTFLKQEIQKHDARAKVHLKIMPNLWSDNKRVHGIDLEALTEMSEIIGNDSSSEHKSAHGRTHEWAKKYSFDWRELCMAYDFMKSVSPNKINFNSELHYLSTVRSRDLYLDPEYAKANFWLAHSYGMTASQIWFWPRKEDGSIPKSRESGSYAGTVNQQPRVTNEVAMTLIDLNANAEEIMAMQRQRKPIRLFYSKTSAINNKTHMDDLFEMYEALHFEGIPLGFVTKNILEKQNDKSWDLVLVFNTPHVTEQEVRALQDYLDKGRTIIIDDKSLLFNEYGKKVTSLKESKGTIIRINTISKIKEKALSIIEKKDLLPKIEVIETNKIGAKGCIWKVVKNKAGNYVLSIVNVGRTDASLKITLKGSLGIVCKDIINGIQVSETPVLKPYEVYFVEVEPK